MRIVGAWLIAMIVLLSIGGSGCSGSSRSKDLAALDSAYHSGVLNKDEYEAKKAGVESQSEALGALDSALASGVVTQADYRRIKARLIAKGSALASLERARRAGVFSQEEYLSRKAPLLEADNSAAGTAAFLPKADSRTAPAPIAVAPQPIMAARSSNDKSPAAQADVKTIVFPAAQGMKTIDPPQGGKIVYGQVEGQTTEAGAMGVVLRSLHTQLGERPEIGKLFQVRGTQSVAAFFSVSSRNRGGGPIAGLVIATKATSDHVEVALVADDAERFSKTLSPMMKTLFGAWHPLAAGRATGSGSSAPAPLRQITLADRSASVGLPDGWTMVPNMSAMGTIVALGPKGESAELGVTFLAMDPNNPTVQGTLQVLRNGGLRNTIYATSTYYPYGADMAKTFVDLLQNLRHKNGLPPASFNFTSAAPVPVAPPQRCIRVAGTADLADGKGPRELNAVYCAAPPSPTGDWMSAYYMTMAPVPVAPGERATLGAILQSFNVNQAVVTVQAARIAAPAIAQIHEIGKAAAYAHARAEESMEIHNSSVYKHWDDLDKRSQDFQNYQLDYTVISDADHNAHGTLWSKNADELVKSNPDRFEYVSAPNYWKGIDY